MPQYEQLQIRDFSNSQSSHFLGLDSPKPGSGGSRAGGSGGSREDAGGSLLPPTADEWVPVLRLNLLEDLVLDVPIREMSGVYEGRFAGDGGISCDRLCKGFDILSQGVWETPRSVLNE